MAFIVEPQLHVTEGTVVSKLIGSWFHHYCHFFFFFFLIFYLAVLPFSVWRNKTVLYAKKKNPKNTYTHGQKISLLCHRPLFFLVIVCGCGPIFIQQQTQMPSPFWHLQNDWNRRDFLFPYLI